jgi:signal transduction histidine kinase
MSQHMDSGEAPGEVRAETGLEALRQSPEFGDSVEPSDGHEHEHSNDHFALIYDSEAELYRATVPFVRQGLERGEQVLYVLDERSEAEVVDTLRARGIDVDEALASGALRFETVEDTYLRKRPFDPAEMISFYADAIDEALKEYEGLRVTSGTNWIDEISFERFLEYEGRVNELFEETESMALCHYDREHLPSSVIRDVIKTHPHLISDGTVCHNVYYTPPAELFGPDQPENEVDRMLGTLTDRADAKTELAEHKRFLQQLYGITADPGRTFEEKLQALFELGSEQFDMELGGLNKVDPDADRFEVEHLSDEHANFEPGVDLPLSETYCQAAVGMREAASITDPLEDGFDDTLVYEEFGARTYLGTHVPVDGDVDRTFGFIAPESPSEPISPQDRTYIELMGQWVKYELDRRQYQADLEETVDELRQSNDRLTQFAYAASHDLQEPLRMVSTYLRLLEDEFDGELDEEARQYLEFAVDGADRMREMVEDLLAYSRVEGTGGEFQRVDSESVLEDVRDDLWVQIEQNDAEIRVDSLPTLTADSEQVEQLFQNLLSNAIKYNDEEPPRIDVSASRRGDLWEFSVADNGIGIEPENRDRIFEVFKRLHHDDEYPGTGIGLSLCQEIVENHGGDIRVESTPGEGSTFYFTLPAVTDD